MSRKTSIVRPVAINGTLVLAARGEKVADVQKWFERSEKTKVEDLRVLALTDKFRGRQVSDLIETADFEPDDLPVIL